MFQTNKTLENRSVCNIVAEEGCRGGEALLFASIFTYHPGEKGRQGLFSSTPRELQCLEPGFVHGLSWPALQAAPEILGAISTEYKPVKGTF